MSQSDQPSPADQSDMDAVRAFIRTVRIACDELHAEPFNADARAALVSLLDSDGPTADAALLRVEKALSATGVAPRSSSAS